MKKLVIIFTFIGVVAIGSLHASSSTTAQVPLAVELHGQETVEKYKELMNEINDYSAEMGLEVPNFAAYSGFARRPIQSLQSYLLSIKLRASDEKSPEVTTESPNKKSWWQRLFE